ncbi:MAG: flagellin N-terminal helical domain-containing protein, partial [Devosia sp.]
MSDISLSKAVRSNLLSLQSTAASMAKTQERLATGLKVNSALDNPTNFFTASALNSRASDMANLLDSMSSGIKTIEAADNGLKSITKTVESMQSALRQARQDKSFKTESYTIDMARTAASGDKITFTDGAFAAATSVNINNSSITTAAAVADVVVGDNGKNFTVTDGTTTSGTVALATGDTVQDIADKINTAAGADSTFKASVSEGKLVITSTTGNSVSVTDGGTAGAGALLGFGAVAYSAKSVDEIVLAVNKDTAVSDKVRASNDNGKLRIQNLSTTALSVSGTVSGASSIGGNDVRANLVKQFNELRDQLDKFADDASFNGIN